MKSKSLLFTHTNGLSNWPSSSLITVYDTQHLTLGGQFLNSVFGRISYADHPIYGCIIPKIL